MHKKLALIGLPGSGKSTFAVKLGKSKDLPVIHLDKHMFHSCGKKREKSDFIAHQKAMVAEDAWIIEGCAISSLELRFARADAVIYFQLPRLLCIWRILKRFFFWDKTQNDNYRQIFNWEIIAYTWNFDKDKRAQFEELRKKYPHVKFLIFKSSKDADDYLGSPKQVVI